VPPYGGGHRPAIATPLAGDFLKENLRLNDLPPMKYRAGQWGALESIAAAAEATAHFDAAAQATALAGGSPGGFVAPVADLPVRGVFDLIIGSDLLYERDPPDCAPAQLHRACQRQRAIWIIDPDRGNRAAFSRQMAERGYGVTKPGWTARRPNCKQATRGVCWCMQTTAPNAIATRAHPTNTASQTQSMLRRMLAATKKPAA
jgi:hypothetical protein